jgi:hypothetical protein
VIPSIDITSPIHNLQSHALGAQQATRTQREPAKKVGLVTSVVSGVLLIVIGILSYTLIMRYRDSTSATQDRTQGRANTDEHQASVLRQLGKADPPANSAKTGSAKKPTAAQSTQARKAEQKAASKKRRNAKKVSPTDQ